MRRSSSWRASTDIASFLFGEPRDSNAFTISVSVIALNFARYIVYTAMQEKSMVHRILINLTLYKFSHVQAGRRLDSAPSATVIAMAIKTSPTCKSLCAQITHCCHHTCVCTGLPGGCTSKQGPIKFWGVNFER